MPRLARSEKQVRDYALRAVIEGERVRIGMPKLEFYKRIGMSPRTYNLREADPEKFTRGELLKIANVLNISMATLLAGDIRGGA